MNAPNWVASVVLALGGVGGLVSLVTAWANRSKISAEAEAITARSAMEVVKGLSEEMDKVRDRLTAAEGEASKAREEARRARASERETQRSLGVLALANRAQSQRIDQLTSILRENGIDVPAWNPPSVDLAASRRGDDG